MTDTDSDGQILRAEVQFNDGWDDSWEAEWAEERTLTQPSRWWFASTAFPLIAGTIGPMANAFNICALVEPWRERIPHGEPQGAGDTVDDPPFVLAVNGLSLAFALISNAALLLNMVGRVSFAIAQPITTIGFMLASLLLLSIVGVNASGAIDLQHLPPGYRQKHTQGFYYATFAAANYFFVSVLMVITVWGALVGKYEKQFQINNTQRTLMLQTISFMAYLLVGAAIFGQIEGWKFNNAVYWADFTLLTIGIGDRFVPKTHAGRTLTIFYTFGGIVAVGLVISSIRTMIIEKGSEKLHARMVERRRQHIKGPDDVEWGSRNMFSCLVPRKEETKLPQNERVRRKSEFYAMRKLQTRVKKSNQYRALAISSFNAALLWFLGALVFFEVEWQDWTYFEALYFSYTTLITLGYGDFQPKSNCGRAFFVFWTLLAIPTLTVLINDMGDTVVKFVADATDWLGSLTIAPGDEVFFSNFRQNLSWVISGRIFTSQKATENGKEKSHDSQDDEASESNFEKILNQRLSDSEKEAINAFCKESSEDAKDRDIYFYHFLVMKEIRHVLDDTGHVPPKQYSYDEWEYYLKLLGQSEEDPSYHTVRYNALQNGRRDDDNGPQVARIVDHRGQPREWSWLSLRSPLNGLTSESQWILNRLLGKLQADLNFKNRPGRGIGDVPAPISLSKFMNQPISPEVEQYLTHTDGGIMKRREATFARVKTDQQV